MGDEQRKTAEKPYPANNLKALRTSRGWTQDRAASEFGLSKSGYIKIESGVHKLSSDRIQHAAALYQVNEADVIRPGGSTQPIVDLWDPEFSVEIPVTSPGTVLDRVLLRMKVLNITAEDLAKATKRPTILSDLKQAAASPNARNIDIGTINALAPVLKATPAWLFLGAGGEEAKAATPRGVSVFAPTTRTWGYQVPPSSQPVDSAVAPSEQPLVMALYGGVVEAGTFREVDEFSDLPPPRVSSVRDKEFPFANLLVFDVRGDSMNALTPVPITDGSQITAIEFESLNGRVVPYSGMTVVIERTRDGGHLRELSVKQIEIYEDRWEYHPRSNNDRHKPIVVSHDMDPDDGTTVRILAWVRKIMLDIS